MVASLDLHAGRLEQAVRRTEALLEEPLDPLAGQQAGLVAALALVDLGRHEEAAIHLGRLLETAAPDVTGRGDVLFTLAEAALWGGRPEDALDHLARYLEYAGSEYPTSFLVEVTAAWAAIDAGRPIPPRFALGEPTGMLAGARLERAAIEQLAASDPGAATTFDGAASAYAGFHRRGELRARWAAAEARRRAGDVDTARAALETLEAALVEDGFAPLLGRAHRSLRLLGVRRTARLPSAAAQSRLTAREREIAVLVGLGLTNQEIARRLGLGRPTVARLLSNAMLKVGVDSRGQLAARQAELA
jgi:DNA-binding CsgD family transcriptional regulator